MNQQGVLQFIYDLQMFGIKFGLENTRMILNAIGDPHLNLNVIHIAGTNGKGSTAAMSASILKEAGFKVGLYTSPHLIDLSERFQINGLPIEKPALIREASEIYRAIKGITFTESYPTYFEALTCLAFSYFSRERCDFAIMEVGMGGRLDATNVCIPMVTAITNIALDHQQYLGNTLIEIATEKAGIIKPGCPLVCGITQKDILELIAEKCKYHGSPIYNIHELYKYEELYPGSKYRIGDSGQGGSVFCGPDILEKSPINHLNSPSVIPKVRIFRDGKGVLTLKTPLIGRFQIQNTFISLEIIERLRESGFFIDQSAIREGLRHTIWPGRIQLVSKRPYMILDGAHNPQAAEALIDSIKTGFKYKHLLLVLGILKDKDIIGISKALVPEADTLILTSPEYERAASVEELHNTIRDNLDIKEKEIICTPNMQEALNISRKLAGTKDMILITGSLYTIGEAMWALGIKPYLTEIKGHVY